MGLDTNGSELPQEYTNSSAIDDSSPPDHRHGEFRLVKPVDRRVRGEQGEFRYTLHKQLSAYFPDTAIYDEFTAVMSDLFQTDFKGLREASCQFKLLEVDQKIKHEITRRLQYFETEQIKPTLIEPETIIDTDELQLSESVIDKDQVTRRVFELVAQDIPLSKHVLEAKNWSPEYGQKFIARVAEQIFKAGIHEYPSQIPADLIKYFLSRTSRAIEEIHTNRLEVARSYVAQTVASSFSPEQLPDLDEAPTQSSNDVSKIEAVKQLPTLELATKVLGTVRENSEHVRRDVIPHLLKSNADSQTAFWTIHAGEFAKDPLITQLLSTGAEAELMEYATSVGGDEFYARNIGRLRQHDVVSGGLAHVDPQYLPELQSRLFSKIDSFTEAMSKEDFIEFVSQIDVIMYALHLPFDGSGRAIEDFICYLSEKFQHPLTLTVLGYREAGSPLMATKEIVGPSVKKELNAHVLHNLGIDSAPIGYKTAIKQIKAEFNCSAVDAWVAYDTEMALITADLISKLGTPDFNDELGKLLPSYPKLQEVWSQAPNLRFIPIPDDQKAELDEITASISLSPTDILKTEIILRKLSFVRDRDPQNLSDIINLLKAFTVTKRKTLFRSPPKSLYRSVFPNIIDIQLPTSSE